MSYKIVIQEAARLDILSIIDYIAVDFQEPDVAEKMFALIIRSIYNLSDFPKRNRVLTEEPYYSKGYRVTYVKNYAVFYKVDDTNRIVDIMRVLYNRREWQDIL